MAVKKRVLLLWVLLLVVAAAGFALFRWMPAIQPGAGAAYQQAPDAVTAGSTATVTLRLAVWGAGGQAAERYRDVRLLMSEDGAHWLTLRPASTTREADGVAYQFRFQAPGHATAIRYRFAFVFDDQPKQVAGKKMIVVSAAPTAPG